MEVHKGTAAANYRKVSAMIEQLCVCVFIPSPVMEGLTLLGDDRAQFFQIELKPVRRVRADPNLKIFQRNLL